jgi:hypothetical protein
MAGSEMSGPGAGGSYGSTQLNSDNVAIATREGEPTLPTSGGGSFSQRSTSYNFTTKQQANFSLEQAWLDMFGVVPSAKIKREFYSLLNKMEKKYATRSKTSGSGGYSRQTSKGYTFSTADLLSEFVQKYTPSMFKQGNLGETAAKLFDETVTYANNMGVTVSPKTILSDVTNNILKKTTTKDIKDFYRNQAIKMYPDLAKRLQENSDLTIRDLASTYINKFSVMFDKVEDQVSLTDPDIMDALSKNKSMSDFTASLKKRADYGVTTFAKQEASDLAQSFKSVWGF